MVLHEKAAADLQNAITPGCYFIVRHAILEYMHVYGLSPPFF